MTPNNNLSILPFYDSVEKQNHRKDYAYSEIYPLITPDKRIPPFQIIIPHGSSALSAFGVSLHSLERGTEIDIRSYMVESGLKLTQFSALGYDVISYSGFMPINIDTPEGRYYIEVFNFSTFKSWFSDVFTVVRSVDDYLKLSYSDNSDLIFDEGRVVFDGLFEFRLYLPTQLGRPDYEFEETVDKRDGYQFIEKQISEKTYKFTFVAPEYLLDALRLVRMMDNVTVVNKNDTYRVDQFLISPKWLDGGYLASVEAEFQCNTVIKKTGGVKLTASGDFNSDFNNDFLKQ